LQGGREEGGVLFGCGGGGDQGHWYGVFGVAFMVIHLGLETG
jgi:hypothetical protein